MTINTTPTKLKVNLTEAKEVAAAVAAANPQTSEELEQALKTVLTTGPLLRKCYWDEVQGLRPLLHQRHVQGRSVNVPMYAIRG